MTEKWEEELAKFLGKEDLELLKRITQKEREVVVKFLREKEDLEFLKKITKEEKEVLLNFLLAKFLRTKDSDNKFLELCESDPDACLGFIEKLFGKTPELEFPLVKLAKAVAYGSKGVHRRLVINGYNRGINLPVCTEEELRYYLGITDTQLDYLEKGLQEFKNLEAIDPIGVEMMLKHEYMRVRIDTMAYVLERCRPGRVQQMLGKTKLKYFSRRRIMYNKEHISELDFTRKEFMRYFDIFFTCDQIAKSAALISEGRDNNKAYLMVALFKELEVFNERGERTPVVGFLYLYDDGTFTFEPYSPTASATLSEHIDEEIEMEKEPKKSFFDLALKSKYPEEKLRHYSKYLKSRERKLKESMWQQLGFDIDNIDEKAWYWKGVDLYDLGRYEEAISCFNKALDIEPEYIDAWNNKGVVLSDLGRYEEAISCYDKALNIDPRCVDALINRGIAFLHLKRYEEAISCYDKALNINRKDADAWYGKGYAFLHLKRYKDAISCYDKALKINPNFEKARNGRKIAEEKLREEKEEELKGNMEHQRKKGFFKRLRLLFFKE